jgi:hypothetical protein
MFGMLISLLFLLLIFVNDWGNFRSYRADFGELFSLELLVSFSMNL